MKKEMTQAKLKDLLAYDPDTGIFTWLVSATNSVKVGSVAGTIGNHGYLHIMINGRRYLAHRLAWMYVHGRFPCGQTDHINHERLDNRINNLREVTADENSKNLSLRKSNKSGFTGVFFDKYAYKWRAQIKFNDKIISLGYFINIEDAIEARKEANIKYSFHENHGAKPCN